MNEGVREHGKRRAALQEVLRSAGLDGALFVHGTDVLYLSGTRQDAALWIPVGGAPALLVRRSLERARAETDVVDVRPLPPTRELRGCLSADHLQRRHALGAESKDGDAERALRIGLTFDVVPVALFQVYQRALAPVELVDVSGPLREARSVKSRAEIAHIRAAGDLVCDALREVASFLRPGMTEIAVAAELDQRLRRAGSEGVPRARGFNREPGPGVIAAGSSATHAGCFDGPVIGDGLSAASPMGASRARVERDAPVVLDYTAVKDGYVADVTRIAVCGQLPLALERAFAVALSIQDELSRALRPGAIPRALWERAVELASSAGLRDGFMGPPGAEARFVGHGVGLELDELPVLAPRFERPLVEGQVLAIEPKFVFPGLGAVGIENTWAVTPRGGERLTELEDSIIHGQ